MTVLAEDWMPRARHLADQLVAAGKLRSTAWRDAVCAVPRHKFVPDVFRQELAYDVTWRRLDTTTEQGRQQWLEALEVHDGHRVLEIGTGTGYNVGPLRPDHRHLRGTRRAVALGDPDPPRRCHPHRPQTHTRRRQPGAPHPPRRPSRGTLRPDLRGFPGIAPPLRESCPRPAPAHQEPVTGARAPHHHPGPAHPVGIAGCVVPGQLRPWGRHLTGYCRFQDRKPTATSITVGDGSWAEVTLTTANGVYQVAEASPRRVWRTLENAHARWTTLERPGWDRFGLTVTEDHQHVWLDTPTSSHTWPLPPAR